MRPIKFGTDGWRGVIADDFTFERAAVVFRAIGEYLLETGDASRGIALGFDNRFAAGDFAYLAACILTRQGIRVRLAAHSLPTPVISYVVRYEGLGGGVMITASHNPAAYSGIKFKSPSGASASPEETARFEARANALLAAGETGFPREPDAALLTQEDFIPPYLAHVKTFVDVDAIRAAAPRIMVDSLYGSSQGVLDRCLREVGCQVSVIHDERNPGFGGLHPEPIPHNIGPLREALGQTAVDGAVISDGDGDRLAAMTGDGFFLSPHYVFSLLLMHLVEDRHMTGAVVKTVSSTTMLDRLTQHYGLKLLETPIGFKYIAQLMMTEDIMIGGEESGGVGFRGHVPERDATLMALYLVEMMAMRGQTMAGLLAELRERVGAHAYDRIDVLLRQPVTPAQFAALRGAVPTAMAGVALADINAKDGLKLLMADGSWLLLRASGTEPVLRIYAEGSTPEQVRAYLDAGLALATGVGIEQAPRR